MGRAIVREPSVFLMDEPLCNLDAKLRVQMRAEVSRIQRRVGVATLYVTHDQTEAMTMGDRVAVLRSGVLQQCDRPQVLYDRPANLFVAAFIGSPAMNLYEAELTTAARELRLGSQTIVLDDELRRRQPRLASYAGSSVVVGFRPEDLSAAGEEASGQILEATVDLVEALGSELLVHFSIDARWVQAEGVRPGDEEPTGAPGLLSSGGEGIARVDPRAPIHAGTRVRFALQPTRLHFFDARSGEAIR